MGRRRDAKWITRRDGGEDEGVVAGELDPVHQDAEVRHKVTVVRSRSEMPPGGDSPQEVRGIVGRIFTFTVMRPGVVGLISESSPVA
ncbi:hypothetical protein CLCR_11088 [Cladophialophora carrionii]|uniref:Uncharacterized protein n=1 Tax=Cladophialophora carrionii TaxID=86049 RepID=A0A1C1CZ09_9EURO|nr:hypothetical protein CLCR_11088 [Cladophialophora carrionii]